MYYSYVKCNRIKDYSHLSRYLRELYLVPGIAPTVDIDHIKRTFNFPILQGGEPGTFGACMFAPIVLN